MPDQNEEENKFKTEEKEHTNQIEQIKLFRIDNELNPDSAADAANAFAIQMFAEHGNWPKIGHSYNYVSVIYTKLCTYTKTVKTPKVE